MTDDKLLDAFRKRWPELAHIPTLLSKVTDEHLLVELARPDRVELLKAAWSAYTRSKQKEHKGGRPKGKKRKAKAPATPEHSPNCAALETGDGKDCDCGSNSLDCADCPNIKCESCPNRPATPEHLSDCVDPLCGGCR